MIQIMRKMAVRTKLMSSFMLLASFVLILGVTAIIIQQRLETSQKNTMAGIRLSDAFFEGKYFLRSDMHIFTELMKTESTESLSYWWGEHEFQIQFFNDQLLKVENEFKGNRSFVNDTLEKPLLSVISVVRNKYDKQIVTVFKAFYSLKKEELELKQKLVMIPQNNTEERSSTLSDIAALQTRYIELNKSVTQTGMEIITELDKGKDRVRILINQIEKHGKELMTRTYRIFFVFTLIGVIFSVFIAYYISHLITRPVKKILEHINRLGDGEHPDKFEINMEDEFGTIQKSMNALTESLIRTSQFSHEIGNENFDFEFKPMGDKDVLGNSLIHMRDSLKKARAEEIERHNEDEIRNWATQGLTKFGDILRQSGSSLKILGFNIMSNLIDYMGAVQGALFVINEENPDDVYYELISAIAYSRDKYLKKEIRIGEGLVGRVAYEKRTIYLKEVPNDYVKITSGLGTANPKTVLLVPVKLEGTVNGVIELISFRELLPYQIEFVERIGENVGSYISSIKISEKTTLLLTDSQNKSEELAAQEEEMRQNMEELQATQEEATRREEERNMLWDSLGKTTGIIETDIQGIILTVNEKITKLTGIANRDLGNQRFQELFLTHSKENAVEVWNSALAGIVCSLEAPFSFGVQSIHLKFELSLVQDSMGHPVKVLVVVHELG